ncbi:unnamed protein product, partial [Cyprideis torosa]
IHLGDAKQALVAGRLAKRLKAHNLTSYSDYIALITRNAEEAQSAVDLLTTNETYFFREPQHFDYLRDVILPSHKVNSPFRVWSAACSTGEEPYSVAMLLSAETRNKKWEITATDLSTRVLSTARRGCYSMSRIQHIPKSYLNTFCLKGTGPEEGNLLVDRKIRNQVHFMQLNLNEPLPDLGSFDLIFLRNVMIYFKSETKKSIVARLINQLKVGGFLFIGHSESMNQPNDLLEIYLTPGEFHFGDEGTRVRTLLGEGGVIFFWHKRMRYGVVCHFRFTTRYETSPSLDPAFADEAMNLALLEMSRANTKPSEYCSKIFVYSDTNARQNLDVAQK